MPTDQESQHLVTGTDTGKQAPTLSSGAIGGANLNRFFDLNDPYIYFTHDLFFFFFPSPCFA